MKLSQWIAVSALTAFAFISTTAFAETYHFGEGDSSPSGAASASHHAHQPKHNKSKTVHRDSNN
jgi:hypothetical protein